MRSLRKHQTSIQLRCFQWSPPIFKTQPTTDDVRPTYEYHVGLCSTMKTDHNTLGASGYIDQILLPFAIDFDVKNSVLHNLNCGKQYKDNPYSLTNSAFPYHNKLVTT